MTESERDGWFAMGFVHAQDRLWQTGVPAPHCAGAIGGTAGRACLRHRSPDAHARPRLLGRAHGGEARSANAREPRGLRGRRQCGGRGHAGAAGRIPGLPHQARAVETRRQPRLAAGDVVGPFGQLALRAGAPALRGEARARSRQRNPAALPGRPGTAVAGLLGALQGSRARGPRAAQCLAAARGCDRIQQLGGLGRAHRDRQAVARERSAPGPAGAGALVSRARRHARGQRRGRHAPGRCPSWCSATTTASPGP